MFIKYNVRLFVENSRGNTLVKRINFITQVEISYADLNSIICHLVKDNYRYEITKGWKLSKTANIYTFEEALIAIRDFRFVESNIEEEEVYEHTDTVLCSLDTNFFNLENWHSGSNSFCRIGTNKISESKKLEDALLKAGFKETKTKGTYYITGDYIVSISEDVPCNIILRTYYTKIKRVQKTVEI